MESANSQSNQASKGEAQIAEFDSAERSLI